MTIHLLVHKMAFTSFIVFVLEPYPSNIPQIDFYNCVQKVLEQFTSILFSFSDREFIRIPLNIFNINIIIGHLKINLQHF